MKINLKNVKNALKRDEMKTVTGGSYDGYTQGCTFGRDSDCPSGKTCSCTTTVKGQTRYICC